MDKQRLDKWLFFSRAVKSRTLAQKLIEAGSIRVNSERAQYWLSVGAQPTEAVVAIFKRSGDWQAFSGDTSPSGIDPQPAPRDKVALFNAALAEADSEPATPAISKSKKKAADVEAAAPAEAVEA